MTHPSSHNGGETGKCTCARSFGIFVEPCYCHMKEQQPAAESVKPCPFCGPTDYEPRNVQYLGEKAGDPYSVDHAVCGCSGPVGNSAESVIRWNNAWVWKQISALSEERNAAHRRIAELEELNAALARETHRS